MPFQKGHKPKGHRQKGSTTKPRISDYLTEEEINQIVEKAKSMALQGNEQMIKLLVEQNFGKAPQALDVTSGGKKIGSVLDELST